MNVQLQLERNKVEANILSWEKGLNNCTNGMYFDGDVEKNNSEYNKLLIKIVKAQNKLQVINLKLSE